MKTLEMLLREGTEILKTAEIGEARLDAWLLLEYITGKNRAYYYAHMDQETEEGQEKAYLKLCRKRAEHIPLQHLTGTACFMGYDFFVDERVLVPRQDTEILVEEALNLLKKTEKPRILDMCTGSGCILLSILKEIPEAEGTGADLSEGALQVAEKNVRKLGLDHRAVLVHSDLFSGEYFSETSGKTQRDYDMLVSNPPYIPTGEIETLMDEVRTHDPYMALDGKEDGLYFYRILAQQSGRYLKEGGFIYFEIGCDQAEAVGKLLTAAGFGEIETIKDEPGLDRVVRARRNR